MMKTLSLVLALALCLPAAAQDLKRETIDLAGRWSFALDSKASGEDEGYTSAELPDSVTLPGTTDTNGKGHPNDNTGETTHLSRYYSYTGPAWYSREVEIPASWEGRTITLTLERTRPSKVWVDGKYAGSDDRISTAQRYDLTRLLTAGRHRITVRVDNSESIPAQVRNSSHACSESTQTNWNGIIGRIELEAADTVHIAHIKVYPDPDTNSVRVKITVAGACGITDGNSLTLSAEAFNSPRRHRVKGVATALKRGQAEYDITLPMGEKAMEWSEFSPALYRLKARIEGHDEVQTVFGLRRFSADGTQFAINGLTTFLRGKHDACVFPLTGHTAMDVESWRRYFRTLRDYGINHCRFHSWCPPRACFEAADIEGIYLQPELPFWGSLKRSETYLVDFLRKEGANIQQEYGNHASFVMFALGNELSGDLDLMREFTDSFRQMDSRHLYAFGSNNFLGTKGVVDGEDYLVTCKIGPREGNSYRNHVRGSFSYADAYEGGYINNTYPNSQMTFNEAVAHCPVPVVSHETGQFQVYPHYAEMEKYTGVLAPWNFEIFRNRLQEAGMLDQADDFFKASGRWAAQLYKADIEMDLRTEKLGGFQLLDLQDYPGQGSAYVGMLDAFMDSKGLVSPEEWREFCNDVVPLFITEKFCWTNRETLSGQLKIADYSNRNLNGKTLRWTLKDNTGAPIDQGTLKIKTTGKGLSTIGVITPHIASITRAQKVCLELLIEGTDYKNHYALWVYPDEEIQAPDEAIYISKQLDEHMINELQKGNRVLWFPDSATYASQTVGGLFQTDYWNYRMFKSICDRIGCPASPGTLGLLTSPEHPLFTRFPTDSHTNWQWYSIIKQSYPLILDRMPAAYRPIVQGIDNVERNHKLGLIFEFNVEGGKLLICMANLDNVKDKPEVRSLYNSMIQYMKSSAFSPNTNLSIEALTDLFTQENDTEKIEILDNISY